MFNTLYRCELTIARHESGPLAESRGRFLEYLAEEGASRHMLRDTAAIIYRAAVMLKLNADSTVEQKDVERAARQWACRPNGNPNLKSAKSAQRIFYSTTRNWLRFTGKLQITPVVVPHQREIDDYCSYLEKERGLVPESIAVVRYNLGAFFKNHPHRGLRHITLGHLERFLKRLHEAGHTKRGISAKINSLRGFFNYGETQGWTRSGLGRQLHHPRIYRFDQLPQGPSWTDVQRLLASTETDRAADIRDRPILLLFAVYGLRAGEVSRLRLEDIDWQRKTLTIPRTKQRQARLLPLIDPLAEALKRYIQDVRPQSTKHSRIFLTLNGFHKPIAHGGFYPVVGARLKQLGVSCPRMGPHGLRHACATHLLAQGLTLTEIGGHLGHSSADATRIYAKVDMPALRAVADLDLGGLL
jgi:integrase/recombinase XerD